MAGDHKTITAVISLATTNHHPTGDAETSQQLGRIPARVFHQDQPEHAKVFDRNPVDIANLFAS
jgi:hypothetical protein